MILKPQYNYLLNLQLRPQKTLSVGRIIIPKGEDVRVWQAQESLEFS